MNKKALGIVVPLHKILHHWRNRVKRSIKNTVYYMPNYCKGDDSESNSYLNFLVATHSDSNRLREFLHAKITKRKKQIHPAHNPRFNHDMQLEIGISEYI